MSSTAGFKQEMPPAGGYASFQYERIRPTKLFKSWMFVAVSLTGTFYGLFYYKRRKNYLGKLKVERMDTINALEPLLQAERDRAYLRQMRYNRDTEKELMKNVPGWVVGTIWGAPIYKTLPKNALPDPILLEWYAHRPAFEEEQFYLPDDWVC